MDFIVTPCGRDRLLAFLATLGYRQMTCIDLVRDANLRPCILFDNMRTAALIQMHTVQRVGTVFVDGLPSPHLFEDLWPV